MLTQAGYLVKPATDAGKAMELFVSERPDLVVAAVDLPKLDGAHLGQLIRANAFGKQAVVVAIDKGHLGKAKGLQAVLDLKVNAYVADPVGGSELLQKLAALAPAPRPSGQDGGLAATLSRTPVAAGDLRTLPLPALLHSHYRLARNGVLVVAHRELTRRVFLLGGRIVAYDSTARQDALANWLCERGELNQAQANQVLEAISAGTRIGTALADAHSSLAGEELLQRIRDYTRDKAAQLVGMREGRYAFYAGDEFASDVAPVEIPALAPILEGARRGYPVKVFAQALKAHKNAFPYRTPEFGKDLPVLGLGTADLKTALQMNGRIRLDELLAHGRGDLRDAYALVWFLALTGDVGFADKPLPISDKVGHGAADRISPKKKKPLPADKLAELRDAAVKIITGSYFKVLGLDITADTEAVERAYHEVATRFHPDSYPEYDTSPIKDLLESVQDKLSASYRVLSVEEKRKAYLQYLLSRLDVRRTVVNAEAEIALKRGEAALKRKDARSAIAAFEEAVALNPREPEYYCFLAWATYLAGEGNAEKRARAAQKLLKKALSLNPYLERAMVISAIIEGETGDAASARKRLLKVLEMNPGSQLAKAALRKVGR